MATNPRRLSKQAAGSLTCDGDRSIVIDGKRLPRRLVLETRIPYRQDCQCGREVCGEVKAKVDIAPHIQQAVDEAIVGAFQLPVGSYEAQIVTGHAGTFLSGVLRKT